MYYTSHMLIVVVLLFEVHDCSTSVPSFYLVFLGCIDIQLDVDRTS
jgi:hypothetical protein